MCTTKQKQQLYVTSVHRIVWCLEVAFRVSGNHCIGSVGDWLHSSDNGYSNPCSYRTTLQEILFPVVSTKSARPMFRNFQSQVVVSTLHSLQSESIDCNVYPLMNDP
jgi:hypothetical protein